MQIQSSPLRVIIDPSGIQFGMPGDTLEFYVVVTNQSEQGAVIDLFFDEASQTLHQWCRSPRESLALGPQQSSEVTFEFDIPVDALPGTYDYTLVVDAPEHFPEDTPIQYPRQLKVMLKEQTVVRVNDPTFSLKPATNPDTPAILKPGEPLQVEVTVDNRSNRVDRFRLTCPDLEEDWFKIRYSLTGVEGPGLLVGPGGLELNPGSQGKIWLQFQPPIDTLAGNYTPTLRLYSANSPDLVLLDLVYIEIPTKYHLDVELNTIQGKVSRSSGKYEIKLLNRGNTPRELAVGIESRDEEKLYTYQCDPSQVRVLPNRSFKVNLTVHPIHRWWRRPLIGEGIELNFIVELQDLEELPLPEKLPKGTLVWKARPWWQFLLLALVALGFLGGLAFVVWLLFFKPHPPTEIVDFTSDSASYTEGDEVRLDWQIRNFDQLSKLELKSEGPVAKAPDNFDFRNGIPDKLKNLCQQQEQMLSCNNFPTGDKKAGDYTFTLGAFSRGRDTEPSVLQNLKVKIDEKPVAKVVSFRLDQDQYTKGSLMRLSWKIQHADQLSQLQIISKTEDGSEATLTSYAPNKLNKALCKEANQVLTCTNVPVATPQPGKYTFELRAFSQSGKPPNSQPAESKIEILPKPFNIVYFTINGSETPNQVFKEGQTLILSWKVEGEDIDVQLSPYGDVATIGSQKLIANQAIPPQIQLIVTDKSHNQKTKGFSIKVETPPPPPSPSPNNPIHKLQLIKPRGKSELPRDGN